MSDLPASWSTATFGDVILSISNGVNARQNKQGIGVPVTRIETIAKGKINLERLGYVDIDNVPDHFKLDDGDILFSHINSDKHLGKTAIYKASYGDLYHGVNLLRIKLVPTLITPEFFIFQCEHARNTGVFILSAQHAVNQSSLNQSRIKSLTLSLPPLAEQKRIVANIDSLSAKSRHAREHLDHAPALVEKYKQAILDTVFRRFRDRQELVRLVIPDRGIPYGIIQTGKPTTGGIPTVRGGDIKGFRVSRSELKAVDAAIENNYRRTRLQGGEVLIAIRGSVGEPCVVPPDMKGCNISREVAMIPVREGISPSFVMYYLASSEAKEFILGNTKGVAQQGINLGDLCELPTPLPSDTEQQQAVQRIEKAFNWIDRLASETTSARKLIDHLDQAILAKAFRGELVPQVPSDEPASVLLERIREERVTGSEKDRRRGRRGATA